MNTYYDYNYTCPNCHEPNVRGLRLKLASNEESELIKCGSCNSHFSRYLNFNDFSNLKNKTNNFKIPLIWRIKPNIIEKSYLKWIKNVKEGIYVITWPWKNIKFLPILVSEFILNNNNHKTVVIADLNGNNKKNIVKYPSINDSLKNLIVSKEILNVINDPILKKETQSINKKNILILDEKTYYVVKRSKTKDFDKTTFEGLFDGTIAQCKKYLINKLTKEHGKKSIKTIKSVLKTKSKIETLDENGFLDIKIGTRDEWAGDLIDFERDHLYNILTNTSKFKKISEIINITSILNDEDELNNIHEDTNILCIDKNINEKLIFETINLFNPDITFIEDFDFFIKDTGWGNKSKLLYNFFDNNKKPIITFSTNPDVRYLLNLRSDEDVTSKYKIDLHSFDCGLIIDELQNELANSNKYSPFSNEYKFLPSFGKKHNDIKFIPVEEINILDECINKLKDQYRDYKYFFNDLKRSPLYLVGDMEDSKFYKRTNFFNKSLSYEQIMMDLRRNNEELFSYVFDKLNSIYVDNEGNSLTNPLFNKIEEFINVLTKNENNVISIIVHGQDVKGLKNLLKNRGFENLMPDKINVYKWKNLYLREKELETRSNHIVISSRPPSLDYQIYYSKNVDKFVFIGSNNDINIFKEMIEYRLTEDISRPLNTDLKYNPPYILKKSIEKINNRCNTDFNEIIKKEFNPKIIFNNESYFIEDKVGINKNKVKKHKILKEGEKAIFAKDKNFQGMFLPLNKRIFFKIDPKNSLFNELEMNKSNLNNFKDKEIVIDRNGAYTSFRYVFTKFMIEYGDNFEVNGGRYNWKNFKNLLEDSYSWITLLKKVLNKIIETQNVSFEKSEEILSNDLASLDIFANNPSYVTKWWSDYEIIDSTKGTYNIYEVEHPLRVSDLKNIYEYLKKSFPELNIDVNDAEKSYTASRTLQRIRNDFFKNKNDDIEYYDQIYSLLRDEVKYIFDNFPTFKIKLLHEVVIKKEVNPLEILNEHKCLEYI